MQRLAITLCTAIVLLMCEPLAEARVNIDIDLSTQTMHVAADGGETYAWPISSGKEGYLTPTGRYRPQRMYTMVHSLKYDNAPMPHSIFFRGGYAIHGSNSVRMLGHPASHGCIRLAPGNASVTQASVTQASTLSDRLRIDLLEGRIPGVRPAEKHWPNDVSGVSRE